MGLTTALAATLGAPFWFGLLSRFVKVRCVGPLQTRGEQGGPEARPQP